ncbi:MAG: hypothetical protein U1E05_07550 [Patescibacteria group bacterium]|nr:hypothetical protein [Patescibacteria group bacterium]
MLAKFFGVLRDTGAGSRGEEVARLRRRLAGILVARECLTFFFVWIMLWAATVVGLRAVLQVDRLVFLWGLLGLLAAAVVGVVLAVRKLPAPAALRAALDRHARLGGLLMAAGDTDIGGWNQRMADVSRPTLQWRPQRQITLLAAAVAFLLAALLVPDRAASARNQTLEIGGEIQTLVEKINVLKEEEILAPDRIESLQSDLERIRQNALGSDPGKTMEAIDHLDYALGKSASDAAELAAKDAQTAGRMQQLAQAMQAAQGRMDPKQFAEAMQELAEMAEQAAAESQQLAEGLSEELKNALEDGMLTEEQLQALAEAMGQCQGCQQARLAKLANARLIDPANLIPCEEGDEFDPDALLAALLECEDGDALALLLRGHGMPGRGGISRGPAPAAMSWKDPTAKGDAAFKEKVLPPGAIASLKESRLAGISAGDPTAAEASGGSTGGVLASARAGGGEAHGQVILPQHEKTVQRYFTREKK